jgi:hypothetical protein
MPITTGMMACSPITRAISARGSANPGGGVGVGDDDQFGLMPVISTRTRIRSSSGIVSHTLYIRQTAAISRAGSPIYRTRHWQIAVAAGAVSEEPMFRIQLPPAASLRTHGPP